MLTNYKLKPLHVALALALAGMSQFTFAAPIVHEDVGDATDSTNHYNSNPAYSYNTFDSLNKEDSRSVAGFSDTNAGSISNPGSIGIHLNADSTADATSSAEDSHGSAGSVTSSALSEAYATASATVGGTSGDQNIVSNQGTITAGTGIQLRANATANASAFANSDAYANTDGDNIWPSYHYYSELPTSFAYAAATSAATASINGNTINNSGTITASDLGINLVSTTDSTNLAHAIENATRGGWPGFGREWYRNDSITYATAISESILYSEVDNNSITNSGAVIVANGHGINLESLSGLNSSSPLTAVFAGQPGVDADRNVYNNYGTVEATSYVSYNAISNTGIVAAAGANSDGVRLYAETYGSTADAYVISNEISNTGKIYAGRDGVSLMAYADGGSWYQEVSSNTITNTYAGRIVAGNVGVNVGDVETYTDNNTITNSGLIVSDPGMSLNGSVLTKSNPAAWDANAATAIKVEGYYYGYNTLNLQAPGYLAGRILLNENTYTDVNLTSGISHSVRWAIQHDTSDSVSYIQNDQNSAYKWVGGATTFASLSGTVPWFVSELKDDVNNKVNDVYATIDPTAFAAAPNQLADLTSMVSAISRDGMAKNTDATDGFWMSAQGGVMNYDGNKLSTMKQDTNLYSVALGYNRTVLNDYRVGVVVGYSDARFDSGSFYSDLYSHSYNNKARGGYLGARGETKLGPFNADAGLAAGFQNHDDKRFVNDNLVWWGQSTATSSYNSYWFSPEVGLSLPIPAFAGFTVSPNVRLTYSGQHIDSYTESGTNSNATIDGRYIGVFEGKVGLNIANSFGPVDLSADIGYLGRSLTADDKVKVTMIGDVHDVSFYYRDVNAGYLKAKASLNINENVQAGVTANYTSGTNLEGGNVMGTLKVNF